MNDNSHRAAVGPSGHFDTIGALQFMLMVALGLREHHTLLDIGCGCLRGGRFFIVYLEPEHYYGIEPVRELLSQGAEFEIGESLARLKKPQFYISDAFDFHHWRTQFDYVLAQSVLTHTSPGLMRQCLRNAFNVMGGDSVFAFTVMFGDNYDGPEGWVANGRVASYHADVIDATLRYTGFNYFMRPRWPHPSGQTWYVVSKDRERLAALYRHLPEWKEGLYGLAKR